MDLRFICYLITIFATGFSCQDSWVLEAPAMLKPGNPLSFVNNTIIEEKEDLWWRWMTPTGDAWNVHFWFTKNFREMEVSFHFKGRIDNGRRKGVGLTWSQNDKDGIKCTYDKEMIKQPEWKLTVRDVTVLHFIPLERDWVFRVGKTGEQQVYYGTGLQMPTEIQNLQDYSEEDYYDEDPKERNKRSPQYDSEEPTEAGFGEWMTKIWDFFFGEGDRGRGEPEGIFARLGNWLRGISCSLHGPCDQPEPSDPPEGPFPPRTVPTTTTTVLPFIPPQLNPDAEVLPELNNV